MAFQDLDINQLDSYTAQLELVRRHVGAVITATEALDNTVVDFLDNNTFPAYADLVSSLCRLKDVANNTNLMAKEADRQLRLILNNIHEVRLDKVGRLHNKSLMNT